MYLLIYAMAAQFKKIINNQSLFFRFILSPKRGIFVAIAILVFTTFAVVNLQKSVYAATGINRTINFQGKVVNKDGTNIADGQYTFVFKLYDAAAAGANPWTETQNNVQVTAGIFRVSLGSVTTFASANVDFNTDNLYLGINFNSDGEMAPRVRFAAVPYAINAEKVAGLTVTNTSGTLTIPNSKTVQFGGAFTTDANDISFTTSGGTTLALPTTGTLATLAGTENLSNKTFTSTITISGVATDITTGANEVLTITPNGTGNVLINPSAGGQSALIVNKTGFGDIFAASASGITKFVIQNDGTASSSAGFTINGVGSIQSTNNQSLTIGGGSTGNIVIGRPSQAVTLPGFDCSGSGAGGKLTTTSGGILTCAADGQGTGSSPFGQNDSLGTIFENNTTLDLLIGGVSSTSAKFAFLNVAGGNPTFKIFDSTMTKSISFYHDGTDGNISVSSGALNIGTGTGDITFDPVTDNVVVNLSSTGDFLIKRAGVTFGTFSDIGNFTLSGGNSGGNAEFMLNQTGVNTNDLFAASASGTTKFVIKNDGTASSSAGFTVDGVGSLQSTKNQSLTIGGGSTGELTIGKASQRVFLPGFDCSGSGNGGKLTTTSGGVLTCAADGGSGAGGSSNWVLSSVNGTLNPINNTLDLLIGGTSTQSAMFSVLGVAAGINPSASVSAQQGANATKGIYMSGDGSLQSVRNNFLTIGGNTTGDIYLRPLNSTGMVRIIHGATGAGGLMLGDSETNGVAKTGRIKSYAYNSDTSLPITMMVANNSVSNNGLNIGGGSASEYAVSAINFYTAKNVTTAIGTQRFRIDPDGYIAIANNSPRATLDVRNALVESAEGGTLPVASFSGTTSFAGLVVDNTLGDLFTASSSGLNRFVITQGGNVGIGLTLPQAKLDIKDLSSVASQGSEKITNANNSTFASDTGDWTADVNPENWAIYGSKANKSASGATPIILANTALDSAPVSGNTYRIKFDYTTTASSSGSLTPSFGSANGVVIGKGQSESVSNQVQIIVATGTGPLTFTPTADWYGTIDNVYVELMTSSSVALRLEASDGTTSPLEIRTGGDTLKNIFIGNGSGRTNTTGSNNIAVGYKALSSNTTGSGNTANGYQALYSNTTGSYNAANGGGALQSNTTANYNTASGYTALYSNTTGNSNTANGYGALISNTTGNYNTAIGASALNANTTGTYNTTVGLSSLFSNTTGNFNTANGMHSLYNNRTGNYNTANGYQALFSNITGSSNTANGYQALRATTGNFNTAIGYNAGYTNDGQYSNATGSNNLYLGYNSGTYTQSASFNNSAAIGAFALVNASNSLVLGGTSNSAYAVNVGIGTATPSAVLDIQGGNMGGNAALIINQTGNSANDLFTASASGVTKFTITNNGTASSSAGFTIDGLGSLQSTKNQSLTIGGGSTGELTIGRASQSTYLPGFDCSSGYANGGKLTTTLGGVLTCAADISSGASTVSPFDIVNGLLFNANQTVDFAIGGTSTISAEFVISQSGTRPTASVSAKTSNAALVVDNSGVGALITASSSGVTQLVLTNNGSLGLGLGNGVNPTAKLDVNGNASISGLLAFRNGSGSIQTTQNNTLTIGGGTTGNIIFPNAGGIFLGQNELTNGLITLFSSGAGKTDPTIASDANGNLILSAPSGSVQFGNGTGNVTMSFTNAADIFAADKTVTLAAPYTGNDYSFTRVLTGGSNAQGGTVLNITDTSGGSGTINPDLLFINSALTSGNFIGNLARFQQNGIDQLRIAGNGNMPVATISANTSFAALVIDNKGFGDIFTASTGGVTKFTVKNNGQIYTSNYQNNGGILYTNSNGILAQTSVGNNGQCLQSIGGGTPTWGPCGGGAAGTWDINTALGTHTPGNNTLDLLVGGTSTQSAMFSVLGIASGTNPSASVSATAGANATKGIYMSGDGSLQSVRMNSLTVGGSTTGDIYLRPGNSAGMVRIVHGTTGAGGLILQDNETDAALKVGRLKFANFTNTQAPVTGLIGVSDGTRNQLYIGGNSSSETAMTILRFYTAAALNTLTGIERMRIDETGGLIVGSVPALGTAALGTMDIRGISGTLPVAIMTGTTSNAGLVVNNNGVGDLFTASASGGITRFTVANNGAIGISGSYGVSGTCLITNGSGAAPSWAGCASGSNSNWWTLQSVQGTLYPINTTLDMLWGGTTTASASLRLSGSVNSGTVAVASVSANTSFAGLVVDNRGSGELFTASASGQTRFTIYNNGDVVIGNNPDSGFKLEVQGSVKIGNNLATDDITKDSTSDFTQSGYAITTNDSFDTVSTSGNQLKLVTDMIGAGATPTAPAAGQATGTNVTTGSVAFQRPDKKFVVFVGGAATSRIYDPTTGSWSAGPGTAGIVSLAAGARAFQRQNGSFLIMHGGVATTSIYQPGAANDFGTVISGPNTTGTVGAGSQIIRRTDGKVLVIHGNASSTTSVYDPVAAIGTTSLLGTFMTGPATTTTVTTGSVAFPGPDGKWLLMYGGASSQATAIYNPSATAGGLSGGTFATGPTWTAASATNAGGGAHAIQLPDGRYLIFLGGGSAVTIIFDWKSNSFVVGPSLTGGDVVNAGGHSFQRSDGQWVVVEGSATNQKNLQQYDPTNGANGTFSQLTGAYGLNGATGAGAGSTTIQKPDGTYLIIHGAGTGLTTAYDAGWNTTGTWTSEDITNTNISTYSAMMWSANPQSANNNARLDAETINFSVKTGDTLTSLTNNAYRSLQDSGDLIRAYGNSQYAKIQISFTSPIRSYPSGINGYVSQTNIWGGEGNVFFRRSLIQPSVFGIRIQNPLVGYGDPSGQGDPAFGRNFATASAMMEGVVADNSNRLTLATLRNFPTATASAGFIIASASANLGGNAGAGAHTIERNNGQFITILGNGLNTTRVYDTDSSTWSAGPTLPGNAGAGAHSFLLPDGRFFVVLGGTSNRTAIFDPQSNLFLEGPRLFGNVGIGANTFQRSDGLFVILNGGVTTLSNILDPFNMAITQGPNTTGATPNVGAGAMNIKRPDGRILIILGNNNAIATGTNVYDPASNTFAAGPALVGGTVSTGGNAMQISTGRVLLFKSTATSNYLDPIQNTFLAGPTALANAAGSFLIPRSDGKILKSTGATNTTSIIDPAAGTVVTGTSAPTLPCSVNTGSHVFQRQTGEYVVVCGNGTAGTFIVDAGWNLGGTYTTEQIQVPNLSSTSSLFWKNTGQGSITVKYRTAATQQALGVAAWRDAPTSGSYISPAAGDGWLQVRFDLQGALQDLPGAKSRVWNGSDSGGGMVYYRQVQTPVLQYWKLMNIQDPTLLTLTSGGNNVFRFSTDGQAYTSDNGAWNSGGADLAERYQSQETLSAGEVVAIDRLHSQNTKRSTISYDQNAMGVVSTQPGFVAGAYTENSYPIALVGRVPVKVSTENGEIHAGDYLTSASIPGYAMKATVGGRVIGQAMEPFGSAQGEDSAVQDCPKFGAGNLPATQCGTITVFVNLTSYNGQSVDVAVKDSGFVLNENTLPVIPGIDFSTGTTARQQQLTLQFLKTQADHGQSVYTDHIAATQDIISPQIVTDLLIAKKIKAESIEGLDILVAGSVSRSGDSFASGSASLIDTLSLLSDNQKLLESSMASLSAKLDKMGAINLLSFAAKSTESSDLIMVNNFASFGTTTLSEVSVMNTMTIGSGTTLTLSQNAINTLGDDLNIQSMRQGAINFLGGLIKFDTDGKAKFAEEVSFQKNINVAGVMTARTISSTELQLGQGETIVVSDTEVAATAAAGLVILKKGTDHVIIDNPLVRDNSFIFITPKTRSIQQLFLKDQTAGVSFTVGVDAKADADIKFNYLIVN